MFFCGLVFYLHLILEGGKLGKLSAQNLQSRLTAVIVTEIKFFLLFSLPATNSSIGE